MMKFIIPMLLALASAQVTTVTLSGGVTVNSVIYVNGATPLTITVDQALTQSSFGNGDVTVGQATGSVTTGSETCGSTTVCTYVLASPTDAATYTLTTAVNVLSEGAGTINVASAAALVVVADVTAPTLAAGALTNSAGNMFANAATSTLTVTFVDAGSKMAAFSANPGSNGFSISSTGSAATISAVAISLNSVALTLTLANLAADMVVTLVTGVAFTDAVANPLAAAVTHTALTVDLAAPTAGAVMNAGGVTYGAAAANNVMTITWVDASSLMDTGTIAQGDYAATTVSGTTLTIGASPTLDSTGKLINGFTVAGCGSCAHGTLVTVAIAANAMADRAGNGIAAAYSSIFTIDATAPTVVSLWNALGNSYANAATSTLTLVFSDADSGFDTSSVQTADFSLAQSTGTPSVSAVTAHASDKQTIYLALASLADAMIVSVTIGVTVADLAGVALAAAVTKIITVDTAAPNMPTVTGPTANAVYYSSSVKLTITVAFGEIIHSASFAPWTAATAADVTITKSGSALLSVTALDAAAPCTDSSTQTTCWFAISGAAADQLITVVVPASVYTDKAGNANTGATTGFGIDMASVATTTTSTAASSNTTTTTATATTTTTTTAAGSSSGAFSASPVLALLALLAFF